MTTARKLEKFIAEAAPGESFVYYVGDLATDCTDANLTRPKRVRDIAWQGQASGAVLLTQRRLGESVFEYIAIKRAQKVSPR